MTQNIVQYSSPFILQVSLGLCNNVRKVEEFLQPAMEFKTFKLHVKSKGSLTNYADKILAFFAHLAPWIHILSGINVDQKWTFLNHLPNLSCKCSLWTPPKIKIHKKNSFERLLNICRATFINLLYLHHHKRVLKTKHT